MNTPNSIPWDTFTEPCGTCADAVKLAAAFGDYHDSSNISFTGLPILPSGRRNGEETMVVFLVAHCEVCKDRRKVLTADGKRFVQLCEELGLITGAELEKRLDASKKRGENAEVQA